MLALSQHVVNKKKCFNSLNKKVRGKTFVICLHLLLKFKNTIEIFHLLIKKICEFKEDRNKSKTKTRLSSCPTKEITENKIFSTLFIYINSRKVVKFYNHDNECEDIYFVSLLVSDCECSFYVKIIFSGFKNMLKTCGLNITFYKVKSRLIRFFF